MPTFPWMLDVEAQMPPPGEWKTPPFDPRFPNQNQTRNCYQNFLGETVWARLEGRPPPGDPRRPLEREARSWPAGAGPAPKWVGLSRGGRGLEWRRLPVWRQKVGGLGVKWTEPGGDGALSVKGKTRSEGTKS